MGALVAQDAAVFTGFSTINICHDGEEKSKLQMNTLLAVIIVKLCSRDHNQF